MFWDRTKPKEAEATPQREPIQFSASDDMFRRASNIWYALGFVNDRMGAIPQLAGYLSMYNDWDKNRLEQRVAKLEDAVRELNPGLNL